MFTNFSGLLSRGLMHNVLQSELGIYVLVFAFSVVGAGCKEGGDSKDKQLRQLSISEIHEIAWPAARDYFNKKYATGVEDKETGLEIKPLPPDFYTKPTSVIKRGDIWVVLYGGAPSGPAIKVYLDKLRLVQDIEASYAAK